MWESSASRDALIPDDGKDCLSVLGADRPCKTWYEGNTSNDVKGDQLSLLTDLPLFLSVSEKLTETLSFVSGSCRWPRAS